jgi:high-affinity Fe2+/Pb2+ permease
MYDIISTALIVAREGFESLLLTAMITAALPHNQKPVYYLNFVLTWFLTFVLGWQAIDFMTTYVEHIENIMKVVAGIVLIYVYLNSKAIFQHAKEHVDVLNTSSFWLTNLTIFLIVLREAVESLVFLRSTMESNFDNSMIGIGIGSILMLGLLYVSNYISEHATNKIVFRYLGPALAAMGLYYIGIGAYELAEIYGLL